MGFLAHLVNSLYTCRDSLAFLARPRAPVESSNFTEHRHLTRPFCDHARSRQKQDCSTLTKVRGGCLGANYSFTLSVLALPSR